MWKDNWMCLEIKSNTIEAYSAMQEFGFYAEKWTIILMLYYIFKKFFSFSLLMLKQSFTFFRNRNRIKSIYQIQWQTKSSMFELYCHFMKKFWKSRYCSLLIFKRKLRKAIEKCSFWRVSRFSLIFSFNTNFTISI